MAQNGSSKKELKAWNKERRLIPVMIKKYCRGNHKSERKEQGVTKSGVCEECRELTEFALFRLDKCPFKINKKFCSFCKIHCYKPDMRVKIKAVMKYSGPRMLIGHPIFAISHVVQMINYKKQNKVKDEDKKDGDANKA